MNLALLIDRVLCTQVLQLLLSAPHFSDPGIKLDFLVFTESLSQDKKASPENISKLGTSSTSAGQGSKDDSQVPIKKSSIRPASSKISAPVAPAMTVLGAMAIGVTGARRPASAKGRRSAEG